MIRDRKQNKKRERGASLVEFAIAATVFLTVDVCGSRVWPGAVGTQRVERCRSARSTLRRVT